MEEGVGPVSDSPGCDAVLDDETSCDKPCEAHILGYTEETGMACFKSCEEHAAWVDSLVEVWANHAYEEPCETVDCVYARRLNAKWN